MATVTDFEVIERIRKEFERLYEKIRNADNFDEDDLHEYIYNAEKKVCNIIYLDFENAVNVLLPENFANLPKKRSHL